MSLPPLNRHVFVTFHLNNIVMSALLFMLITLITISQVHSQDCAALETKQSDGQYFGLPWLPEVVRRFKVTINAEEAIIYLSNVARANVGTDSYYTIVLDGTFLGFGSGSVGSTILLGDAVGARSETAVDFLFPGREVDLWIDVLTTETKQRIEVLDANGGIIIAWDNLETRNHVFIRYIGVRNWGPDARFEFCDVLPILRSRRQPTQQSTTHSGFPASLAIDGHDEFTLPQQLSCTLTGDSHSTGLATWWMVDLGQEYDVRMVIIINREDEDKHLLFGSQVLVGSCPPETLDGNKLCDVTVTSAEGNDGIPILKSCAANTYGQYVYIVGTQRRLSLCEVKVYGVIIPDQKTSKVYYPTFTYEQQETKFDLSITIGRTGVYPTCSSAEIIITDVNATRDTDYKVLNTGVSFGIGESFKQIDLQILQDRLAESNEQFTMRLNPSSAVGASASFIEAMDPVTITILDDDSVTYRFAKDTYHVRETDRKVVIEVKRSGGTGNEGYVVLTTTLSTALPFSDYDHSIVNLHFDPDVTSLTGEISIVDDAKVEKTKEFYVGIEVMNTYGDVDPDHARATVIIDDDDDEYYFAHSALQGMEGDGDIVIEVKRQGALNLRSQVVLRITPGTATSTNDYTSLSTVDLTFEPSIDTVRHNIGLVDDTFGENDEQFHVALTTNAGEILDKRDMLTVTIKDNDARYFLKAVYAVISESDRTVQITVLRRGYLGTKATARMTTSFVTATNNDFTSLLYYPVTFNLGQDEVTFSIIIQDDDTQEELETFLVYIDAADGFIAQPSEMVVTIVDNDGVVNFGADSYEVIESHHQITVDVVRDGKLDNTASVRVLSSTQTATSLDYLPVDETLIFPVGVQSRTVHVLITTDNTPERDETFMLLMTSATNVTLGDTREVTVTIISSENDRNNESSGLSLVAIISMAAAGGVLVLLLLVTTLTFIFLRASRTRKRQQTMIQNPKTYQDDNANQSYPFAGQIATAFDGFQGADYWNFGKRNMAFGRNDTFSNNSIDQATPIPSTYNELEAMMYSNNNMTSLYNF